MKLFLQFLFPRKGFNALLRSVVGDSSRESMPGPRCHARSGALPVFFFFFSLLESRQGGWRVQPPRCTRSGLVPPVPAHFFSFLLFLLLQKPHNINAAVDALS